MRCLKSDYYFKIYGRCAEVDTDHMGTRVTYWACMVSDCPVECKFYQQSLNNYIQIRFTNLDTLLLRGVLPS